MGSVLIIFGNCCLPHAAWLVQQRSNPSASSVHHGGCSRWQGQAARLFRLRRAASFCWMATPVGLEPTIPGSVGRCLIHWATGPLSARHRICDAEVTHLGGRKGRAVGLKPALPGSLGRCLVHWAAGPLAERIRISNHDSDLPGWRQRPSMRVTPPHDGA